MKLKLLLMGLLVFASLSLQLPAQAHYNNNNSFAASALNVLVGGRGYQNPYYSNYGYNNYYVTPVYRQSVRRGGCGYNRNSYNYRADRRNYYNASYGRRPRLQVRF